MIDEVIAVLAELEEDFVNFRASIGVIEQRSQVLEGFVTVINVLEDIS